MFREDSDLIEEAKRMNRGFSYWQQAIIELSAAGLAWKNIIHLFRGNAVRLVWLLHSQSSKLKVYEACEVQIVRGGCLPRGLS